MNPKYKDAYIPIWYCIIVWWCQFSHNPTWSLNCVIAPSVLTTAGKSGKKENINIGEAVLAPVSISSHKGTLSNHSFLPSPNSTFLYTYFSAPWLLLLSLKFLLNLVEWLRYFHGIQVLWGPIFFEFLLFPIRLLLFFKIGSESTKNLLGFRLFFLVFIL